MRLGDASPKTREDFTQIYEGAPIGEKTRMGGKRKDGCTARAASIAMHKIRDEPASAPAPSISPWNASMPDRIAERTASCQYKERAPPAEQSPCPRY